jgi:hypothetical protein
MQASLAFLNGAGIRAGKSGRRNNAFLEVLKLLRTGHRAAALPRRKQRPATEAPGLARDPSGAARGCTPRERR